jgi:hypothetical protein
MGGGNSTRKRLAGQTWRAVLAPILAFGIATGERGEVSQAVYCWYGYG